MSSRQDQFAFAIAALTVVVAMLFGGGPRGTGDALVHATMVPCLALAIVRFRWSDASRWDRWFIGWCIAVLALVIAQLAPLPPHLFASLPQRAGVAADLAHAGVGQAWRPMTLDVWATVRAALAFMTFAATWMLCRTLDATAQRRLLQIAVAVGVALAFFGFAQAAAGTHAIRFHRFHHDLGAIGPFANRNHFAALMAMLAPIALAFAARAQRQGERPLFAVSLAAAFVLWLAAALSYSRAGFALASCAFLVATLWLWWPRGGARRAWMAPVMLVGVTTLAIGHYAWDGLMQRLAQDPLDDLRWQYVRHGLEAMRAYLPWGSGLGSFPWVYAPFEPVAEMGPTFAGRAHNDPLQIAIEAGVPGVLLMLAFVALVVVKAARIFPIGPDPGKRDDRVENVIAIALAVPLLHAWVDYPLRTLAVSVMAGLLLSLGGAERQVSRVPQGK
ncbi:O-antigen polymerase [Lysobacter dokdonensis DS-58]|uniref:O-antigen polymerase n=1 Tax=Lysobacter dokdonensis DS-58 TaxID=1300345 RepID=A0A0A2WNE4_9GAMM|nr:O-antigen ligase family protein [Lysobacter dokdonensis]KGQ20247.1 O-antigen polymerase [Lysobacter dokdonensis DS-58]